MDSELWACGPLDCTSTTPFTPSGDRHHWVADTSEGKSTYRADNNSNITFLKRGTVFPQRVHIIHIHAFTIPVSFWGASYSSLFKNNIVINFLLNWLGWHWLIRLYNFRCTFLWYVICILHCVPTTQSQIIFCHHIIGLLCPLLPSPTINTVINNNKTNCYLVNALSITC